MRLPCRAMFAALACFALLARVDASDVSADAAWSEGSNEALKNSQFQRPDIFGVPGPDGKPVDVPDSMKDIPLSPQNPQELAMGLKKLKALLQDSDTVKDPEVAQKLAMLTAKLKELGVEHILEDQEPWAPDAEQHIACVAMAAKTAGVERPTTINDMRRLAQGKLTREEASQTALWRLAAICAGRITKHDSDEFKKGRLGKLPLEYMVSARDQAGELAVKELEEEVWHSMRYTATKLIKQMDPEGEEEEDEEEEQVNKESPKPAGSERATPGGDERKMPIYFGLLMAIPLLGIFGFLAKIFLSMSKDAEGKKSKKKDKKAR